MKPSIACHEVMYLHLEVVCVSDQVVKKAGLHLVHCRKLSNNYDLVLYVHSKLLAECRLVTLSSDASIVAGSSCLPDLNPCTS